MCSTPARTKPETAALLRHQFHCCFIRPHLVIAQCRHYIILYYCDSNYFYSIECYLFTDRHIYRTNLSQTGYGNNETKKKNTPLGSSWLEQIVNNVSKHFALPAWCTVNYALKGLNNRNDIIWFRGHSSHLSCQCHNEKVIIASTRYSIIPLKWHNLWLSSFNQYPSKWVQCSFFLNVRMMLMRNWSLSVWFSRCIFSVYPSLQNLTWLNMIKHRSRAVSSVVVSQ